MGDAWIYINQENDKCIAHACFNNSKIIPPKCSNIIIPFTPMNDHLSHLMVSNVILLLIERKMFFMKGM